MDAIVEDSPEKTSQPATRAAPTQDVVEKPERVLFEAEGVSVEAFRRSLTDRGLALIVSRNVTTRDASDFQQPFNLRIPGGVQTLGANGWIDEAQAETPPRFDSFHREPDGRLRLHLQTRPDAAAVLESSTDLRHWAPVQPLPAGETTLDLPTPSDAGAAVRFYRLRET